MIFFRIKSLVVALLLVVFSAQGIGLAAGINIIHASRVLTHLEHQDANTQPNAAVSPKMALDLDDLKILSIAEELSDYVVFDLVFLSSRNFAPLVPVTTWTPISIILPRAPPPPRA
jgi:hypothetical protein